MSDENPFDETTEDADGSFVQITIKGGPYNSHEVTLRRPTLELIEKDMPEAIKTVVGAQKSLETAIKAEATKPATPAPGSYGKPSGASNTGSSDLPFADTTESKDRTCQHGTRKASLYQGKTYYACASDLPKGDPGRCEVVVVD
jgi:hypothetical protein